MSVGKRVNFARRAQIFLSSLLLLPLLAARIDRRERGCHGVYERLAVTQKAPFITVTRPAVKQCDKDEIEIERR